MNPGLNPDGSFFELREFLRKPKKYPTSQNDILQHLIRTNNDQQFNFILEFNDRINEKVLWKAFKLTLDIEPVLGCRLVTKGFRTYWERRDEYDFEGYFDLIVDEKTEEQMNQFIFTEINPRIDPVVQIRLFRNQSDTMVIKSDHSIMDGGGFYDFLTLFNLTYNNLIKNPEMKLTINTNINRSLTQVLRHYSIRRKVKSFIKETSFKPTWSFPATGKGKRTKNYLHKNFDPERFLIVKNYGKRFDATINDMVLTAFYRALFKLTNPDCNKKMTVCVPTDLRALLPKRKADSIANLSSSTFVSINYIPEELFEDTLKRVSTTMKKKKEIDLGLGYMFIIRNVFRLPFVLTSFLTKRTNKKLINKGKWHPLVTNIGVIDHQKTIFGDVSTRKAWFVPPFHWFPSFAMAIYSHLNYLSLTICFHEESYDKEIIQLFLDLIEQEFPTTL